MAISDWFTGIRTGTYFILAAMMFLFVYAFFKVLKDFDMTGLTKATLTIAFWIAVIIVVVMGTMWTMQGRMDAKWVE